MAAGSFTIDTDIPRCLLRLTLVGDWTVDTVDRLGRATEAALRDMMLHGVRYGTVLTLIDMSRKSVAPAEVASRMAALIGARSPSRRIALVVGGTLHGMQTKRLVDDDRVRVFTEHKPAMAWLNEPIGGTGA